MTEQESRELKYSGLPMLDVGDIWATKHDGVFVVVSSRPAQWHGEDIDVYAHIDTWYTIRDATPEELTLWQQALDAGSARNALRRMVGAGSHTYDAASQSLVPTPESTRRLDSYDDRWQPPTVVSLTPEQVAIEEQYLSARQALQGHV